MSGQSRIAIVLKGYPRLSETFIAQEILALEQRGFHLDIWSLRRPTDKYVHPMHRAVVAPLNYLPEYLHDAPLRVLLGAFAAIRQPGFTPLLRLFWRDLQRDFTLNRIRRLGQAFVLAREIAPEISHLHVHFLHTPGSVARYAALLTGRRFSFSAHAKDIWTIPAWERAEKIADCAFGVTCTRDGLAELVRVAAPKDHPKLHLVYHGLDLARFPPPPEREETRDGSTAEKAVTLLCVGRAVAKKGLDDLLIALKTLPAGCHWRLIHIGSGEMLAGLKAKAEALGLASRITWRGSQPQEAVIAALREADLFVLPSKPGTAGDRDGLPNVLMEAATQALPLLSTRFAGVPEFVEDGETGVLVAPGDAEALSDALQRLITQPALRLTLGNAAYAHVRAHFSLEGGIDKVEALLRTAAPHI